MANSSNTYGTNKDHTGAVVAGVAAVGLIGLGAYLLHEKSQQPSSVTTPSSSSVASIVLSASPTTVEVGGTVDFTATAYNASNQPVQGVSLILYEITTATASSPATTDSSGTVTWSVTFPITTEPGNYSFVAESD